MNEIIIPSHGWGGTPGLLGVHIYDQIHPIEMIHHAEILAKYQELSVLSWRRWMGDMILLCNEEHLRFVRKFGFEHIYSDIQIIDFSVVPQKNLFWSLVKIHAIAQLKPPFVMVDTDLYVIDDISSLIHREHAFCAQFEEWVDPDVPGSFYGVFDEFFSEADLSIFKAYQSIPPVNAAIVYMNDEVLLQAWYAKALEIAGVYQGHATPSQCACFIEQRLLPMMARRLRCSYSTLLEPIYIWDEVLSPGNEWLPPIAHWSPKIKSDFFKIKHLWGGKSQLNDPQANAFIRKSLAISEKKIRAGFSMNGGKG